MGTGATQRVVLGVGYGDVRKGLDLWPGLIWRVVSACPDGASYGWARSIQRWRWLAHDLGALDVQDRLRLEAPRRTVRHYGCGRVRHLCEDPSLAGRSGGDGKQAARGIVRELGGITDLVREAGGSCVPYLDLDGMARELCRLLGDPWRPLRWAPRCTHVERDLDYRSYTKLLLALAVPTLPSVSAVVPNFNYARHLRGRLESIWAADPHSP